MKNLIPRSVIMGNPDKDNLQISPSGSYISYLANLDGTQNIFIEKLNGTDNYCVTQEKVRNIEDYVWSPCEKYIVYPLDKNGDETYNLFAYQFSSKSVIQLTDFENSFIEIIDFHIDYPNLLCISSNHINPGRMDLFSIDLSSKEIKEIFKNINGYLNPVISPSFSLVVGERYLEDGSIIFDDATNGKELLKVSKENTMTTKVFNIGIQDEVYFMNSLDSDMATLSCFSVNDSSIKVLSSNSKVDLESILMRDNKTRKPLITSYHYLRREYDILDSSLNDVFEKLTSNKDFDIKSIHSTSDNSMSVVRFISDRFSEKYTFVNWTNGEIRDLYHVQAKLNDYELNPSKPTVIKSRDGLDLVCYHTEAYNSSEKPKDRPLIIYIHGGPWAQEKWSNIHLCQIFSNRGYEVISINYRGSIGFGKAFINAGDREWAGKMHDDILDVADWAIAKGICNQSKIALWGGSYGGYATLVGLTFTPEKFACGADFVGPSNIQTMIESFPTHWNSFKQMLIDRVGDFTSDEGREFLKSRSPLFKASNVKKPLLIIQGANDPRVKQAESDKISDELDKNNTPHTYVLFPDEGHGCNRFENWQATLFCIELFFAKVLGGRFEPKTKEIHSSSMEVIKNTLGLEL